MRSGRSCTEQNEGGEGLKASKYIASFDSASAMLRATAGFLRGEDFPVLGSVPRALSPAMRPVAAAVNALPQRVREGVYVWSGASEAIQPEKLGEVNAEEISRWATGQYPRRRYQGVAIGSSNGALVHLYAVLGIPWLPQTFLVPVRRDGVHPDEPKEDMEWGKEYAPALLEANPDLVLHHMHDANQDRLMIQRMAYFRVKRLRLGEEYKRFLAQSLEPGSTVFVIECRSTWPTTRVSDRHVFQHGALGGATQEEFFHGSERVEDYLQRYGSHRRRWHSPEPDEESPEAEWGFEAALLEDVERFAREHGYRLRRVVFEEPEDVSPLVADLYRRWYAERGLLANRLLVESFVLMEPYWALRTGSVPFWTEFATEPSLRSVEDYLSSIEPYDQIHAMLFSHGVESVGLPSVERWRTVTGRACRRSGFIGVEEEKFPRDYATFVRYHTEVKKIPARYPMPGPLTLGRLDAFLQEAEDRYRVRWE